METSFRLTLKDSLRGGPWICSRFDIESFPHMPHDEVIVDFLTCSLGSKATPGVKCTVMELSVASTPAMSSIESMMHNRVNIDFLKNQVEKLQKDVESLKDKVRNNGDN